MDYTGRAMHSAFATFRSAIFFCFLSLPRCVGLSGSIRCVFYKSAMEEQEQGEILNYLEHPSRNNSEGNEQ